MDWDDALPWVLTFLIVPYVLALRSFVVERQLGTRLEALADKLGALEVRILRLGEQVSELPPTAEAPPTPSAAASETTTEPEAIEGRPVGSAFEPEPAMTVAPPPAAPPSAADTMKRFEQILVENWLVWLGGVALALGGAFLVKLSIDYGLLTPPVRVVLAVLLGAGLCTASDWLARREAAQHPEASAPSYVPQAVAAGGAATVFAAFYAAYQLYGLISAPVTFVLLAGASAATVALALRQGILVAALGLVGAYVVPALVASNAPHALPLFLYLAFVTAGLLAVLRHRSWWALAWPALLGAFGWVILWLATEPANPESAIVGGYILVQLGLFAALRRGVPRVAFLTGIADQPPIKPMLRLAFALFALAAFVLAHVADFDRASLITGYAATALLLAFAYRDRDLDDVIATAAALLLAVLATWRLPLLTAEQVFYAQLRLPAALWDFSIACMAAALLLSGGGFMSQRTAARPGRWAAMGVAASALVLVIAYWRLHSYGIDIAWTALALTLAGLDLLAAASIARRRDGAHEVELALAAYAVGVLGATILAAVFALSNAWLTVAIALHLPALGWIEGRINLKVLRQVALIVAGIVFVRLAANPYLFGYPIGPAPIFNWLLYGYGVPAIAFIVATRQFGSRADDLLVGVLEAGSALFTALLLTFELRHAAYGRLDAPLSDLGKDALSPVLWLGLGALSLWLAERRRRPVLLWSGIILAGFAAAQIVFWQVLADNPLLSPISIGNTMIFDVLSLAYLLPALILAAIVTLELGPQWFRLAARVLAASLGFLWLSLEVRHAFRGDIIFISFWTSTVSDGEWYAYSAAWLAFFSVGLAAGLLRRDEWLRRVALGGIGLVIAKVFVSDMAELEGVLRALSFLGLGAALVGIGYAYRRLRPLTE